MEKIGEPCAASQVVHNVPDGLEVCQIPIGYPVVLRPAYTLGGSGAWHIAHNETELEEISGKRSVVFPVSERYW